MIRWGGDEFLVVGHGTNQAAIERLAERIRVELAEHQYQLGNGAIGRMSASIGVSIYPFASADSDSLDWERVVAVADQAAYIAKANRRNAWVGIYPGRKAASIRSFDSINQRIDEMHMEGVIEIRTSIREDLAVFGKNDGQCMDMHR